MNQDNPTSLPVEKPKFTFKSWYETNKEKLSAERKKKYETDPEYRAKVQKQSKLYRKKQPSKPRKKSTKMTIPQLCEKAECSFHTFRKFQHNGWIPKTTKGTVFTETHVKLLAELVYKAKETMYLRVERLEVLKPYIDNLIANW